MTQLTTEQFNTLKAVIVAEPTLQSALLNGADYIVQAWCNSTATPSFTVWKTVVTEKEIVTDDAFDWTRVDNLSVGKSRIWEWMFRFGFVDSSAANVRAGIDATWVGTAADLAVRAAVYTHCKRLATNAEKVLATGTGSNAVPGVLGYEGLIDLNTAGLFKL